MEANDLWYMFKGCMVREDVEEMMILGRALRNYIDRTGQWPTNEGRSAVYHHLNVAAEVGGDGRWHPVEKTS